MHDLQRKPHWVGIVIFGLIVLGAYYMWDRGATELAVVGEATVKAAPDEYVFYPSYQEKDVDQDVAKRKVTELGNSVVAKLKEFGLTEAMLTTNVTESENYDYRILPVPDKPNEPDGYVATFSITATVRDLELGKKVQEYLATTPISGSLTPQSTFSDDARKKLEREARKQALEDAKQEAGDIADGLDVSIRGIKSIGQPTWGGGGIMPYGIAKSSDMAVTSALPETSSAELLVGEQEISYQIQVIYRVR